MAVVLTPPPPAVLHHTPSLRWSSVRSRRASYSARSATLRASSVAGRGWVWTTPSPMGQGWWCSSMAPLAQGRPWWPMPWPTSWARRLATPLSWTGWPICLVCTGSSDQLPVPGEHDCRGELQVHIPWGQDQRRHPVLWRVWGHLWDEGERRPWREHLADRDREVCALYCWHTLVVQDFEIF